MQALQDLLETHPPWPADQLAIYDVLAEWFADDRGDSPPELPDVDRIDPVGNGLRWAPGAHDGVATHHMMSVDDEDAVADLFDALVALVAEPTPETLAAFYERARTHRALTVADGLLRQLVTRDDAPPPDAVYCLADWLATCAPDREPVKLGIALLGLFDTVVDLEPLVVLAHHDELTLFATVALLRLLDEPIEAIYSLARQVRGWGRVQVVERLVQLDGALDDPALRDWLLREGFRNEVLDAYLALICAEAGDLVGALAGEPDDALIDAGRDLLEVLCDVHGPAGDLRHYPDGAVAVERLLGHMERREPRLADLSMVLDLHALVLDDELADALERMGWTPRIRGRVTARCVAFVQQPVWCPLIDARLTPDTPLATFQQAAELGARLGMDTWAAAWARLGEATALRAPSVGLRHRALGVLEHWGRQAWPAAVIEVVRQALAEEPTGEVRTRLEALLGD